MSVTGTPTQLAASVTTLANLGGLPDDAYKDGDFAYVQSTRATYQLDRTSVATPSAVAVDAFSGNGQWVFFQSSTSWETQTTWYIDPAAGDDENDGETTTSALATWAEFTRRVKTIQGAPTSVTVLSNISEPLIGTFEPRSTAAFLVVQGSPTVAASGSTSTMVDPVTATNTRGTVTVTDLVDSAGIPTTFAPYVGRILRVNATAPYVFSVLRESAGVAQGGWWARWTLSNSKPANGSTVEVLTLVTVPTVKLVGMSLPIEVRYFKITSSSFLDAPFVTSLNTVTGNTSGIGSQFGSFFACDLGTYVVGNAHLYCIGCLWSTSTTIYVSGGKFNGIGGGVIGGLGFSASGTAALQAFMVQGGKLLVGSSILQSGDNVLVYFNSASLPVGVFDSPSDGIEVSGVGSRLALGTTFGSGNTGYGVKVLGGGRVLSTGTPTITGASGDVNLSAAPNLAVTNVVPIRDGVPTAPAIAMTTWATWAAARPGGLERYAVNLADGSAITGG